MAALVFMANIALNESQQIATAKIVTNTRFFRILLIMVNLLWTETGCLFASQQAVNLLLGHCEAANVQAANLN
jgi:hypothetical protein